jgi:hypothetical protein
MRLNLTCHALSKKVNTPKQIEETAKNAKKKSKTGNGRKKTFSPPHWFVKRFRHFVLRF